MSAEALLAQLIVGLSNGMILFILASGLTLIFGVMRVINFAHGSLYMLGAYIAITISGWISATALGFWTALVLVPVIVAAVGFLMEWVLFKRIYDKEHLLQLLLTYGLTLIFADVVRIIWGGDIYRFARPDIFRGSFRFDFGEDFTIRILRYDVFLIFVGVAIGALMWHFIQRTRWGRTLRAAVANPEVLGALGVNVSRVFTVVFMIGAALAGLGGVLAAGRASVSLGMDSAIIVQAFAIVVIGGLGSIPGALIGSVLIGVTLSVGILLVPNYADALPFLAMALILIIRPWGLMGKPIN
jgi:branched-chain amino acid transport system permease protein